MESFSSQGPYRSFQAITIESGEKPFALTPSSNIDALEAALAKLLDVGVRFIDIDMADAVKVMKKEQEIIWEAN